MTHWIFLLTIITLVSPLSHGADISGQLKPFTSDGCTRFPESFKLYDWTQCCIEHDFAYWKGGSYQDRRIADEQLRSCVSEASNEFIGLTMKWGSRLGGSPHLPTPWRWGYGWINGRDNLPLSDDEQNLVDQLSVDVIDSIYDHY